MRVVGNAPRLGVFAEHSEDAVDGFLAKGRRGHGDRLLRPTREPFENDADENIKDHPILPVNLLVYIGSLGHCLAIKSAKSAS